MDRVAVTSHRHGLAVYRATARGLWMETSPDGVTWSEGEVLAGADRSLRPVCAADAACGADLFCLAGGGTMVPVRARRGRVSALQPVGLAFAAAGWYEPEADVGESVIVRDEVAEVYRAFFCARRRAGLRPERRGCIGTATSADLRRWSSEPPIFAPNLYPRLFSPHVVQEAGRVLLFYAAEEPDGRRALRYAVAPRLEGPYERPVPDLLACDVRATIHTVRLGPRRLVFFGRRVPGEEGFRGISRPGQLDFHPDGRPFVRAYEGLLKLLGKTLFRTEACLSSGEPLVRVLPRYGRDFRLTARLRRRNARAAGLLIRTSITGADNITVWLEYERGAVTLRRGVRGRVLCRARRPLASQAVHELSVWAEGPFADVYLHDEWILSAFTETRGSGCFGLAVEGGEVGFEEVTAQAIGDSSPPGVRRKRI